LCARLHRRRFQCDRHGTHAYRNIATGYLGTVHFTCSDHKAILPSDYTFVAGDAGLHTFMVKSSGTQTLTATDTHTGSIKGSASVRAS
jgi:hypothetical protein